MYFSPTSDSSYISESEYVVEGLLFLFYKGHTSSRGILRYRKPLLSNQKVNYNQTYNLLSNYLSNLLTYFVIMTTICVNITGKDGKDILKISVSKAKSFIPNDTRKFYDVLETSFEQSESKEEYAQRLQKWEAKSRKDPIPVFRASTKVKNRRFVFDNIKSIQSYLYENIAWIIEDEYPSPDEDLIIFTINITFEDGQGLYFEAPDSYSDVYGIKTTKQLNTALKNYLNILDGVVSVR